MRLIDADKLPIKYDGHTVSVWKNDIDNAPTVKAIPIEWLRMWFSKNGYLSGMALVDKIESDWKEENEQNKESTSQAD